MKTPKLRKRALLGVLSLATLGWTAPAGNADKAPTRISEPAKTVSSRSVLTSAPDDSQVCPTTADLPETTDGKARWGLRAYNSLDCVISIVEKAMNQARSKQTNNVRLSRKEAEQIGDTAWWARDAAARIGR
jgi:hypothetical protein